jgi:hypothetical protein
MDNEKPKPVQIQIKAEDATQAGSFSNFARASHNFEEFTLDFLYIQQNPPFGKLQSRIIFTPSHAKRFLKALEENIKKYEAAFGEIPAPPKPPQDIGFVN